MCYLGRFAIDLYNLDKIKWKMEKEITCFVHLFGV